MKNLKDKRQALLLGLLAFLMILLAVNVPGKFYSVYNFQSMGFQLPELGLLSLGMLLVVITGGIDLSLTFTAVSYTHLDVYKRQICSQSKSEMSGALITSLHFVISSRIKFPGSGSFPPSTATYVTPQISFAGCGVAICMHRGMEKHLRWLTGCPSGSGAPKL